MTSRELRQSFLDFFVEHDHRIMAGSSLKSTDETTLFTSAGMQQFVPWFRGIVPPTHPRVVTCQKCFRADDIEEIGRTPWHLSFFEMLGNFSFGDYFKRGAIEYAWEYVTKVLSLPTSEIWITVHPDDEEAPEIWDKVIGIPVERIVKDPTNWWPPGDILGPCGPDTELHLDTGEDRGCGRPECSPTCECPRFVEFWNLVFQTYNKTEAGELEPLGTPGIDTGMGMERVAALMQGAASVFGTDLFVPIVAAVSARADRTDDLAPIVIAEHARALAFLLAEGFTPSNDGAGYVVRRVLRRAYRFGHRLGIEDPFLYTLVPSIIDTMSDAYPELVAARERITLWIRQEEQQFEDTLQRGLGPLTAAIERAKTAGLQVLPGEEVFKLHDTYGLPKDLAAEVAAEDGLALDEEGFAQAMEEQRQRARARAAQDFTFAMQSGYQSFVGKTRFLGYETCSSEAVVIGLVSKGAPVDRLAAGEEGELFLDQTPFYAESGGQVGDRGLVEAEEGEGEVLDAHYPVEGAHAHHVRVTRGEIARGQRVVLRVDAQRREAIARAHTATHLLHCALREVLGEHALQSGSLVDADRLRFDFAHFSSLTREERQQIEDRVVSLAFQDDELRTAEMAMEQARATGAIALFGEKYGERVRVVTIGGYSRELCGGTHLRRSSAIGGFAIVSEGSIGAGLRRIEAVTGKEAHGLVRRQRELLSAAASSFGCQPEEVPERIEALHGELRRARREISRLEHRSAGALVAELLTGAVELDGVRVLSARVEGLGEDALRRLADDLLVRLGSGIVVLGCETAGRVQFVSEVSKELVAAGYHAGNLIREVAKIAGGGGGGRPDFAQAGGRNPERLDEALAKVKDLVAAQKK